MSARIWVGISKEGLDAKVLVSRGSRTLLKARLSSSPSHPRALQWLLEAIALWEGAPVRAVLSAVGEGGAFAPPLLQDWFPDFGGPLYILEWTDELARPRCEDEDLDGLGEFEDLRQLRLFDALESTS